MPTNPSAPARRNPGSSPWLSWSLLLLSACGFAAFWVLVAIYSDRQLSWLAVLGALDMVWMLRLGSNDRTRPGGMPRALAAVLATLAIVLLANWGIIAAHLGGDIGLMPWESVLRLGLHHAWTLAQLANGVLDLFWIVLALALAGVLGAR
ncbi:hypothetical protein [Montanilutibacter psychrotolerans]|uniref:hypothetical protein n=1 Tax=Montanilutibacter psychrotolerans TaxID=1327343 RepID=UPI0011CDB5AC|nr:hypothetical protein [Lysobacter psychrotolerans]